MSELAILEIFLRGGAVAALLICAALFVCRTDAGRKDLSVATLCAGVSAYVLVSSPSLPFDEGLVSESLVAIAGVVPVLLYWAALELFQDEITVRPWQGLLAVAVVAGAWLSQAGFNTGTLRGIGVLVLFAHLVAVVFLGEAEDLVEERRRFRRWFLVGTALLVGIITVIEITGVDRALPFWTYILHALLFWLVPGVFMIWAVRVDPSVWHMRSAEQMKTLVTSPVLDALVPRIETAMQEGLWQQEGLTVAKLAQHLNTPEHRLRKAINQGLGHRNFSSFINGFRIAAAERLLRDPLHADRTVLSIAFDVGFSSLGPFNRAFRAQTGTSPTEYRKEQTKAGKQQPSAGG